MPLENVGATKVRQVAVGALHVIAITETENLVLAWGMNSFGQLGIGATPEHVFRPRKIKAFGQDRDSVRQAACGENHTIFLMHSGCVCTCGSNEFGQLGLALETEEEEERAGVPGGRLSKPTPVMIEKQILDSVVQVAAGRFHSMAIRKQNEGDALKDDEQEDPGFGVSQFDSKMGASGLSPAHADEDAATADKVIIKDIKHDLFGWGRGYHGQLGLKELKVVQWSPKKIKLKKDPRLKREDQPTRFAKIACGEKHSLVLAVNGSIWWAGEKAAVGKPDPNALRRNQFETKDESESFQYTFEPYFEPNSWTEFSLMRFKFINSNFNSKLSWAINAKNQACVFGEDAEFQLLGAPLPVVYADGGKRFDSLIQQERLPYTWGEVKNGKLGFEPQDLEDRLKLKLDATNQKKASKLKEPLAIPFFEQLRDDAALTGAEAEDYKRQYEKKQLDGEEKGADLALIGQLDPRDNQKDLRKRRDDSATLGHFAMKFPIQQKLKIQDQGQLERDLSQQDVDLMITFKSCIQSIFESQKSSDRATRAAIMRAQDSISARIQTFPVANVEKLEDIEVMVPKLIGLNKQLYEILFTLLQTHPCYLIKWICASLRGEIDLFHDHPWAWLDDDEEVQLIRVANRKF